MAMVALGCHGNGFLLFCLFFQVEWVFLSDHHHNHKITFALEFTFLGLGLGSSDEIYDDCVLCSTVRDVMYNDCITSDRAW